MLYFVHALEGFVKPFNRLTYAHVYAAQLSVNRSAHPACLLLLQEVSLLADLRAVVARALSGLDMFSDADGKLSPTVSGSIGGASEYPGFHFDCLGVHEAFFLM